MKQNTFKFVGTSICNGRLRVRFANAKSRIKTLERTGHTEIVLLELDQAEREEDCVCFLLEADYVKADDAVRAVVEHAAAKLGFTEFKHRLNKEEVIELETE